ncbi:unnamed protein product [Phytophthora lilii]|uniref:Unnamed protein product n=1 Tax=Phytophthora lilii TaxID=2077276 RepID=A0A9W7CMX4_9STRA|nr:unnamed protein product [Phytophthora lilii]
MRNGDYIPSRLEAQHDAANLLCGTKTQANPESTVGVLAMAGKRCREVGAGADCCWLQIAVDVVSMGELGANTAKLQAFVDAASSNNNSHLVTVPAGVLPSDVLVSSPVLHGDDGAAAAAAASSGGGGNDAFAEYGGVDPSMDPELALVHM